MSRETRRFLSLIVLQNALEHKRIDMRALVLCCAVNSLEHTAPLLTLNVFVDQHNCPGLDDQQAIEVIRVAGSGTQSGNTLQPGMLARNHGVGSFLHLD